MHLELLMNQPSAYLTSRTKVVLKFLAIFNKSFKEFTEKRLSNTDQELRSYLGLEVKYKNLEKYISSILLNRASGLKQSTITSKTSK
jgi:hypothetical protein